MVHSEQDAQRVRRPFGRPLPLLRLLVAVAIAAWPSAGHADAILTWNNELLDVIRQTSGLMVDGPPEVAREIAMVDGAMFDAANAASGLPYHPYVYTGPAVTGASVDAAALEAGYQVMNSIFSNSIWAGPGGSMVIQDSVLASIQSTYAAALADLGSGPAVATGRALGRIAATDMIDNREIDGAIPAIMKGLQPQKPPFSGFKAGVYVPPSSLGGRPEMFPQWGTVTPFGTSIGTIQDFENLLPSNCSTWGDHGLSA